MEMEKIERYLTTITNKQNNAADSAVVYTNTFDGITIHCGSNFTPEFLEDKVVVMTHHGKFHMDELIAICILLYGPLKDVSELVILRSRELSYLEYSDYIVDVGRVYNVNKNRFDHHQSEFNIRYPDNTDYASAGLVFMKYGEEAIGNIIYNQLDNCLSTDTQLFDYVYNELYSYIKYVDNLDNGQKVNSSLEKIGTSAHWTSGLNPVRMFSESIESEYNYNFTIAITSLKLWFKNYITKCVTMWLGMKYLDELSKISEVQTSDYLVLPYDLPWKELIWKRWNMLSKYSFIIIASRSMANWSIHHIPTSPNNLRSFKVQIPKEVLGLYEEDIERVTGIQDVIVCNNTGYVTYARTKQAAIQFVEYVMSNHN